MYTLMYVTLYGQTRNHPNMTFARPERASRTDDAYVRLKAAILSADLPPGTQATELEVAAHLGMSRTPAREALIRLEAEGLVEIRARKGVRVLPIQPSDMAEIYEILTAIEPQAAAELARRKPTKQDLAPLARATSDMEAALKADDLTAWAAADDRFHRALLEMHGNVRLTGIATSLYDQAHRVRLVTLRVRDKPVQSTREHRMILDALQKGDVEGVRSLFRKHRERSVRELLTCLNMLGVRQL